MDLATAKRHLSILDDDDASDDALIEDCISAAYDYVQNYVRRDLATDYPNGIPKDMERAQAMVMAHFYENRGAVVVGSINTTLAIGVKEILAPYRVY